MRLKLNPPKPPPDPSDPGEPDSDPTTPSSTSTAQSWYYDPMPYDVPKGTSIRGTPRPGDEARVGLVWAEFLRSAHGYEDGWVGRKPLGMGSNGMAGMWEKRDGEGRVVDVRLPGDLTSSANP